MKDTESGIGKDFSKKNPFLFGGFKKIYYLCTAFQTKSRQNKTFGEMVEWSITTVLKTVVLRGTGGSNPSLSANSKRVQQLKLNSFFAYYEQAYY